MTTATPHRIDSRTASMLEACRQHGQHAEPLAEAPGVALHIVLVDRTGRTHIERETCRNWGELRRALGY